MTLFLFFCALNFQHIYPQLLFFWMALFCNNYVFLFLILTPNSVAAGRYTMNSTNTLNFDKKWPLKKAALPAVNWNFLLALLLGYMPFSKPIEKWLFFLFLFLFLFSLLLLLFYCKVRWSFTRGCCRFSLTNWNINKL